MSLEALRDLIWGPPLLLLILGTGLYLTIRLRGVQFRLMGQALRSLVSRQNRHEPGDISPFQALMTALAGTIGIGSIAGTATAVAVGGPGALVWMVVAALVGMATLYAESFLAITFRQTDRRGEMIGGPMHTLSRGVGWRWMALLFAGAGMLAALTTGNMVQANAVADVVALPRWSIGLATSLLIGLVLLGGIRRIGRVTSLLVPAMALFYFLGGMAILLLHLNELPSAVVQIFISAFSFKASAGGLAGALVAIRMGVARGLMASEAGLGSSSIAAAAAKTDLPGRQALISMTGGFLSVCIVCVMTGLVIGVTGTEGEGGITLTLAAFRAGLPYGEWIVIIGAILFAYSTILSWSFYGERCCEYLFGERSIPLYRALYALAVIPGALFGLEVVWTLADICNAAMTLPNLLSLLLLSPLLVRRSEQFFAL